jgi:hypothetical protein
LPVGGKLVKARINTINGAEVIGSVDHVDAGEMEPA